MEPRIHYTKTSDGVNIAYWTSGEGDPVVQMPAGGLNRPASTPEELLWDEWFSQRGMLIRYDRRGFGNSDRDISDTSIETWMLDLDAVLDALNIEQVSLFAANVAGPVAITYAVRRAKRVTRLILYCTSARGSEVINESLQAMLNPVEPDVKSFTLTFANAALGWSDPGRAAKYAEGLRENSTIEVLRDFFQTSAKSDVTELLGSLNLPTIVLHRRGVQLPPLDAGRALAAGIKDAQLNVLEGDVIRPYEGDVQSLLAAIGDFLGDQTGTASTPAAMASASGGFATILFTDMASSTTLADQLGDAAAQEVRRTHNDIVRAALAANSGSEIKHTGDGIMASFGTASAALQAAIAIQRGVAAHKEEHSDSPLGVYVGLNAGEPIAEEGPDGRSDLFGTSINLAARICDHAEPGQIVAADVVRQLAAGKQFLFADLGETELRGFEDSVKLWEVRWT